MLSYPSVLTNVLGAQKNRLIETVLLSTHNICLGLEIRKKIWYTLLTKVLIFQCSRAANSTLSGPIVSKIKLFMLFFFWNSNYYIFSKASFHTKIFVETVQT